MAEISDTELAVKNRAVALLDRMWNDPKEGMSFKKRVKELIPDAKIPELDIVEGATAPILASLEEQKKASKALADRLDNWEQSQKDTKEENALQARLDRAKKQYSFTPDGMLKLIERMKSENSADVEATAAWVASQEKKAKPITDSALMPSALNLFGSNSEDDTWAELNKDPVKWADRELVKMINEFAEEAA
jgi:hypothetical protein